VKKSVFVGLSAVVFACAPDTKKTNNEATDMTLEYPKTATCDSSYSYFGTTVKDPYGWLEDDYSEQTNAWVKVQNALTESYLAKIPQREKIKQRLTQVWNYEKYSVPFTRGGITYYFKNDGIQNQSVLYKLDANGKEQLVLDPNTLSKDGTVALGVTSFSKDGKYMAYATAAAGSDWEKIQILDMSTGKNLPDLIEWVKFSGIAWEGDGFYYSAYDAPKKGEEYSQKNEFHKIKFHRLGTDYKTDEVVYSDPKNGQKTFGAMTSKDEEYLFVQASEGTSGSSVHFRKRGTKNFVAIDPKFNSENNIIGHYKGKIYLQTNNGAPNWKLVAIDPAKPTQKDWQTIVPEKEHYLQSVTLADGKMLVVYLENVANHLYAYDLGGKMLSEINLPAFGNINAIEADEDKKEAYFGYTNFTTPTCAYKLDVSTGKAAIFRQPKVDFKSADFETVQVFYTSKDGTKVPMFITSKKGVKKDGNNPTFLYGYGGFNISIQPNFAIDFIPFLEAGGVYAVANIRGGSEFGETWHEAGIKMSKQNVFDDFISAAEYLIKEKYTSSQKLAVHGRSNGGLLIGAVMTQRPDLFKVCLPKVGVLDMLRYHKFTIGWAWASDYGRSDDNEEMFRYLMTYSPLHAATKQEYPATMVITGDHDDRVVPAHSFKFGATLQANQMGKQPVLIRIDVNAGHGAGKPVAKQIAEYTDQWAFVFKHLGVN